MIFAVVDLETTGMDPIRDRIIEVGVVLMRGRRIGRRFSSLVNPRRRLSPWILQLTGIDPEALAAAPDFEDVASRVQAMIDEADYFVAHNARFDYGFLRAEFDRMGWAFRKRTLCTVRLGRRIYPEVGRYNLDRMIEHFGISCPNRHRALDDALAAAELLKHYQKRGAAWEAAVEETRREATLPAALSRQEIDAIPNGVGVYVFYDAARRPLYVGKSTSLRDRVLSHFTSDLRLRREQRLKQETARVETIRTPSELAALLLESALVKELSPAYNRELRRATHYLSIRLAPDVFGYERPDVVDGATPGAFGPFRSRAGMKTYLDAIVKAHDLCGAILGLERAPCFRRQIGRCAGACEGTEPPESHNARLREALGAMRMETDDRKTFALLEPLDDGRRELFVFRPPYLVRQQVIDDSIQEFPLDGALPARPLDVDAWKIIRRHMARHPERVIRRD